LRSLLESFNKRFQMLRVFHHLLNSRLLLMVSRIHFHLFNNLRFQLCKNVIGKKLWRKQEKISEKLISRQLHCQRCLNLSYNTIQRKSLKSVKRLKKKPKMKKTFKRLKEHGKFRTLIFYHTRRVQNSRVTLLNHQMILDNFLKTIFLFCRVWTRQNI